jgi:hypothetical protein
VVILQEILGDENEIAIGSHKKILQCPHLRHSAASRADPCYPHRLGCKTYPLRHLDTLSRATTPYLNPNSGIRRSRIDAIVSLWSCSLSGFGGRNSAGVFVLAFAPGERHRISRRSCAQYWIVRRGNSVRQHQRIEIDVAHGTGVIAFRRGRSSRFPRRSAAGLAATELSRH